MKVLFFVNHDGFIRNFEGLLHALAARGDRVHLAVSGRRVALMSEAHSLDDLCASSPAFSYDRVPREKGSRITPAAQALASSRSFLRFLGPEYAHAPKLRARANNYVSP